MLHVRQNPVSDAIESHIEVLGEPHRLLSPKVLSGSSDFVSVTGSFRFVERHLVDFLEHT